MINFQTRHYLSTLYFSCPENLVVLVCLSVNLSVSYLCEKSTLTIVQEYNLILYTIVSDNMDSSTSSERSESSDQKKLQENYFVIIFFVMNYVYDKKKSCDEEEEKKSRIWVTLGPLVRV